MKRGPWCKLAVGAVFMGFLASCAPVQTVSIPPSTAPYPYPPSSPSSRPPTSPSDRPIQEEEILPPEAGPQVEEPPPATPQHLASVHLVQEGDRALGQGDLDGAITLYEQAVQVDGYNGIAFLGLAKAWRRKGYPQRALEFARKAEILLQRQPSKLKETYLLEADLYAILNQPDRALRYREKAVRLP